MTFIKTPVLISIYIYECKHILRNYLFIIEEGAVLLRKSKAASFYKKKSRREEGNNKNLSKQCTAKHNLRSKEVVWLCVIFNCP